MTTTRMIRFQKTQDRYLATGWVYFFSDKRGKISNVDVGKCSFWHKS